MKRLTLLLLLSSASWCLAQTDRSQPGLEEAKTRFKRGTELYDEGNFRGALIEFQRTYQLLPNYKILYNIGQVHLQLLEYARAQEAFTKYLKEGGAEVAAARREEVTRELERLKTRVGRIAITTAEGAEVLVDDESVGTAPLRAPLPANTGRHKVTVVVPGREPQSRVVEVAGLETVAVTLGREELAPRPAPSPVVVVKPTPAPSDKTPMIIGWMSTGLLAIGGGVMAGLAFSNEAELKRLKATFEVSPSNVSLAAQRVSAFSLAADLLGVAAIIGGGVSLYLTIKALSSDSVALTFTPTSVGFVARF